MRTDGSEEADGGDGYPFNINWRSLREVEMHVIYGNMDGDGILDVTDVVLHTKFVHGMNDTFPAAG